MRGEEALLVLADLSRDGEGAAFDLGALGGRSFRTLDGGALPGRIEPGTFGGHPLILAVGG